MIRLAISGTGAITERAHIPAFLDIPGIQIVALQNRTLEKAERVAAAVKSSEKPRIYRDYDEMLGASIPARSEFSRPTRFIASTLSRRSQGVRTCWWKSQWRRLLPRRAGWLRRPPWRAAC